jgi:hypothetical protein
MSTRTLVGRFIVALIVCATPLALLAASPHYKKGGKPTCALNSAGDAVVCSTGAVTGLGSGDVFITVNVSATAGTFCENPGNGNRVPGQNPATGSGSGGGVIPGGAVKNGNATLPQITVEINMTTPTTDEAGCPSGQWTVSLGPISGSGTYTVAQGTETNIISSLGFSFTF